MPEYGWRKNAEGYYDMTSGLAIRGKEVDMDFERGDIIRYKTQAGLDACMLVCVVKASAIGGFILFDNYGDLPVKVGGETKYLCVERMQHLSYKVIENAGVSIVRCLDANEYSDVLQVVLEGIGYVSPETEVEPDQNPVTDEETLKSYREIVKLQTEKETYEKLYKDLLKQMLNHEKTNRSDRCRWT